MRVNSRKSSRTTNADDFGADDISKIIRKFRSAQSPRGRAGSYGSTQSIDASTLFISWALPAKEVPLDQLEPDDEDLDELVNRFPAPRLWYQE